MPCPAHCHAHLAAPEQAAAAQLRLLLLHREAALHLDRGRLEVANIDSGEHCVTVTPTSFSPRSNLWTMLVVVVLASLLYRSLSAGGKCVYNQQLWTTFHLGGAARHSLKSCDQSQLPDLKKTSYS